jgi:hypothetical protein
MFERHEAARSNLLGLLFKLARLHRTNMHSASCGHDGLAALPQEAREIFVFPAPSALVKTKFAFAPIEFVGMDTAPAIPLRFVRHDGVQHFVIENVFEEPERNEFLIEPRIDPDHAIFFLDRAEDKIFFRTFATFPAPNHFVAAQTIAEVTRVYFVEDTAQIEIASFSFQT